MRRSAMVMMLAGVLTTAWAAPAPARDIAVPGVAVQQGLTDETAAANAAGSALVKPGSTAEAAVFYLVAALVAFSAVGCVLSVNVVRMAVFLFAALGAVAILYFLMAATFLGAIQLIVYVGGTLIVIIFGVMLTSQSPWARFVPKKLDVFAGAVVCLVLFGGLVAALLNGPWSGGAANPKSHEVAQFGRELLTTYLVPFELASVLLLAVMIGAAYLARPEKREQ